MGRGLFRMVKRRPIGKPIFQYDSENGRWSVTLGQRELYELPPDTQDLGAYEQRREIRHQYAPTDAPAKIREWIADDLDNLKSR